MLKSDVICCMVLGGVVLGAAAVAAGGEVEVPWIKGAFKHVLDPPGMKADPEKRQWYVNDHCFYVEDDGTIHWFGITNPYPKDRKYYSRGTHLHVGHASAKHPFGPWQEHAHAVTAEVSEGSVGACYVAKAGDGYVMLYNYNKGFAIARSQDLYSWQRIADMNNIDIGRGTRDPCIIPAPEGGYLLYATAGHGDVAAVAMAKSMDLVHWERLEPALVSDIKGNWGPLESPFVHRHDDRYYLFLNHSHHQYQETHVFVSSDPHTFQWSDPLCTVFGHAVEIFEWGGKTYISHCGIEDRHWDRTGLYLAELAWARPAVVQTGETDPVFMTSDRNGGWSDGGYYVHNNMWNSSKYSPCTEALHAWSFDRWHVVARMDNSTGDGAVKTYPNVHKDYDRVPVDSFDSITSTFAASSPHVGIYNFAYDIWINGIASPGCTEIMIWTDNFNQVPGGRHVQDVTFGDRTYKVYKRSGSSYIAFVPIADFTSGTVDLLEIMNWMIDKGWLPATSTLNQICFGVEIVSTENAEATFEVSAFSIDADKKPSSKGHIP